MKQIISIFFLLACGVITICACSVPPDVHGVDAHLKDFKQAKAIFIGKVIDISVDERQITGTRRYDVLYTIKFSVVKNWKGQNTEITAVSDNGKSICGKFNFQIGEKYLVYADAFEDRLAAWATVASPSRPLDSEDFFLKRRLKQLNSFWFRWRANRWHL